MSADDDYERVLLVKPTVYVYRIPPLLSASRGFKASDWNLAQPDWTGRLRLISTRGSLFLRLEDATSGQLYCQAPILAFPGSQVQPVVDSRRYFVIKVVSDTGRTALIGIGFADGADSFDLSVALQSHFTALDNETKTLDSDAVARPELDLSLKGDITVKLNIGGLRQTQESSSARPKVQRSGDLDSAKPILLPPPPPSAKRR